MGWKICCSCSKFKCIMKILVTGATGFIGNNLIKELIKDTRLEIITSSRDSKKIKNFDWSSKTKHIPYDISNNKELNLYEYFGKPERVIHLAWDGLPNYGDLIHIEKNLLNNFNFVKNLISNGLKDISITGTCFEYGLVEGCLKEDLVAKPSNSYAIAKDCLRKFIEELKKQYDFNYKWIRLFYMFGEGQSKTSLIALLDKAIKEGKKEFNMSGGEQNRDYLHIKEVVSNIIKIALQNKIDNQIINCCSGSPISIKEFVESYLIQKRYDMKLNLGHYPYSKFEPMSIWGDNSKLQSVLHENIKL